MIDFCNIFFISEKKDLVELIMKESPYYGSASANESSTKDNNRTTTPNSNNSNSRSTRYLSYSHSVSKRNFLSHHLSLITIIHFTEI